MNMLRLQQGIDCIDRSYSLRTQHRKICLWAERQNIGNRLPLLQACGKKQIGRLVRLGQQLPVCDWDTLSHWITRRQGDQGRLVREFLNGRAKGIIYRMIRNPLLDRCLLKLFDIRKRIKG